MSRDIFNQSARHGVSECACSVHGNFHCTIIGAVRSLFSLVFIRSRDHGYQRHVILTLPWLPGVDNGGKVLQTAEILHSAQTCAAAIESRTTTYCGTKCRWYAVILIEKVP